MIHKKLKELYNVDTISQDKGWDKVLAALSDIKEDIEIDFTGINIVAPWIFSSFLRIIHMDNVYMVFTNNKELVNYIQMVCLMDSKDRNRIRNIEIELPKEKTADEKKIETYGENLRKYFIPYGDKIVFDALDAYTQIHSSSTISYIEYIIDKKIEETGIKHYILNLKGVTILTNVLEVLAQLIIDYETDGVKVEVDIDDEETAKTMGLCIHKATNETYDFRRRVKTIKNMITPGTAGMLIKYKNSRAVDEFGRHGKGEVVSSRIAIYRDMVMHNGADCFKVDTYNSNEFFTKQQWMVEHDNEQLQSLKHETVLITMEQLGFQDVFIGLDYHFIEPIQQDISENRTIILGIDENGNNIKQSCTIPERMKYVFDDWGVDYNKEKLEEAIKKTRENLGI
jgi:hypothetical protein